MIKILLDVNGADYSPEQPLIGAIKAVDKIKDLKVVLVGNETEIKTFLQANKCDMSRFEIIDAPDTITNMDVPTVAIRSKKQSSMVVGYDALKSTDDIAGMVSAGSSGALLTGAFLKIGRIKGVSRPALCPILPTIDNDLSKVVAIADAGTNVDCKPINLVHFAIMGNAYLKMIYNIQSPRVALLNVGEEDKKGNELCLQTFPMLKNIDEINFIGNVEARDTLNNKFDLVVTDGFAGNILLKSIEGSIGSLLTILKNDIKSKVSSMIGAIFMKSTFKKIKTKLDYNQRAGAVLLGCKKLVVKVHGSAKAESFYKSIELAHKMAKADLCQNIEKEISKVNVGIDE